MSVSRLALRALGDTKGESADGHGFDVLCRKTISKLQFKEKLTEMYDN